MAAQWIRAARMARPTRRCARSRAARRRRDGRGASVACVRRRTWRARDVGVFRELEEHPVRRVVRAFAVLEIGQYLA